MFLIFVGAAVGALVGGCLSYFIILPLCSPSKQSEPQNKNEIKLGRRLGVGSKVFFDERLGQICYFCKEGQLGRRVVCTVNSDGTTRTEHAFYFCNACMYRGMVLNVSE